MAYVNVAEWTSQHVGDWLYGLDDSILPYVQFFVNNQINGCRLLLLSAQDLINLNINKIGHQEIILEAVELLRNLHYNITSETLQTIALRLACKSRALFNQLKKSAEKAAAAVAAAEATTATTNFNHPISDSDNHHYVSQKKDKNKDKDKDKDHHHHQQQQQQQSKQQQSVESTIDLSPVSTTTLASVSDILSAVKDFISWIDRYPFDGQDKYIQARKSILQLSIELTSTAQRDQQFVQGPNEVIRQCCKKLADLCDRLVQELNDSLAIQAASLEVVTVTKNMDEDLGMHIHSSYSGIHVVGGLKYHSPAYLNGNIEEGDEIIQVNYQTVVGWQLKKLVASMRRFPTKLILTVKKRPRHHSSGSFTVVPQFALPLPEMSIIGNSSLPLGETLSGISNANIYNTTIMMSTGGGGGGQQYPPPSSSTTTTNQSINNNNNNNTQSQQQQFQSMHNNDNNNNNNSYDIISSTTTTTTNLLNNNQDETIKIDHNNQPQNRKPLSSIMISMSKMLNNNDNHENNNIDNFNERNHLDHHRNNHHHNQSTKIIENNNNKSFKNRNRLIQQQQQQQRSKCQSSDDDDDDDSSPLSDLSDDDDDSSTMFSTDSDTDSDCSNNRRHHHHHNHHQHQQHRHSHHRHSHHHHHHQMNGKQQTNKKAKSNPITNVINLQTSSSSSTTTKMVMAKPTATITTITPSTVVEMRTKHDYCSSDHDEFGNCEIECEEDIEEYNDNDSAFYSGRRTTTSTSTSTTSSKNDDTNKLNTTTAATAKSSSTGEKIKNLTNSFVKIRISKQKSSSLSSKENESIDSGDSGIRERDDNDVVNVNIVNDERTDVKPRTSAEFEQLYLMQQNPTSTTTAATSATLPNVMINMNKTTNKQQQSSTTKTLNTTKSFDNNGHSMMMNRTQSLTSIQLSTITHLTSLAKNIRFANMAQVQQNNNVSLANNTHSKSKFDPVLASKIEKTIHKLSNGDLSMGNYHGYLFTYQGSERIGGNSLDIPTLGIITEQKQLKKWTKIRSVLKDNCLYSYLNDCTNIACFEIPIHLPGYYILVDKQMFLDQYDTNVNVNDNDTVNNDDNEDDTKTLKQLVIFKLVTYHRLFMFAVDSLNELVRWIVRFGYRFCCNPSEQQLCFTYYLSPVHIGQLPSSTTTTVTNSNSNRSLSSKCSTLDSKEFESDDYHDLLTIKSNDSDDGSTQQNHHVKFQNVNCTSTNNDDNNKDAHRFIKSPHPRGSIRFAVRRSGQDMDFIDSTIDVKKTLSETFCSNTETLINDPPPPPPPNLPPRPASSSTTQTITVPTTTQTTTTAITTTTTTVTSDQIPRPKPRISKMAIMNGTSSTTTTTTVNNKVPTTLSSSCVPSQSTTSNMITSAAQRLAPIPVPEKSTHISQTIQHFANLQRQNNLRRSFAQQQQQQQQQITTKNQQQQQQMNYADYDYIINNRPKQSTNDNQLKTTTTSNMNNPHCNMQTTIGNPLYCHVVPMLSNIADNSVHHQSTISSSSSTTTSSSSSSSSDHDVLRSSLPPSIDPPPAPPLQSSLSLQTNENIAPIVPPKPNRNEFNKKEKEKEKDQIETPPPPPPILLPRRPINTGQQPPPIPTTSHPQLLRSNSNQQQRQPPPIPPPVCPKPDLIKCLAAAAASSSTTKSNGGKFLNRSFSDATTKTSNSVSKTSNKNQRNNNQQRRPSLKSRHSLEESTQNVGQIENSSTTTCDDYDETGIFFDNNNNNNNNQQQQSFHRTESIGSFDDQQPQTPTTSITTNFDISPTSLISNNNRPTMGISMLAKKRLSNVSADSLAIEKALNLHHSNTTNTNTNSTSITSG